MKITKKVAGNLNKCYSLCLLEYGGKRHLLAASEKNDKCLLYSLDGEFEAVVWDKPGGVMSMVQIPETDGQFFATHCFYSFNDADDACIVLASPLSIDNWSIKTIAPLPFVHRIDILKSGGTKYLIACTVKSAQKHADDWASPGKVYAAALPDNLDGINENAPLEMRVISEGAGMTKNHGYCRHTKGGKENALVSCEEGVFYFVPPSAINGNWRVERLLESPASDAMLLDIDNDGEDELVVISPFHGDTLCVYKKKNGGYDKIYEHPEKLEFLHAMCGGRIGGKDVFITGNRGGRMELFALWRGSGNEFKTALIDSWRGPANALYYAKNGKDIIAAANRETDEIALYNIEPLML